MTKIGETDAKETEIEKEDRDKKTSSGTGKDKGQKNAPAIKEKPEKNIPAKDQRPTTVVDPTITDAKCIILKGLKPTTNEEMV